MKYPSYEETNEFSGAYRAHSTPGFAWEVLGYQIEIDENGEYFRTGKVLTRMIGDDRVFIFDPDDLSPISDDSYCPECGQITNHGGMAEE